MAKTYAALAADLSAPASFSASSVLFDADAENDATEEKREYGEKGRAVHEEKRVGQSSTSVTARALDAYLDDDAWETRQRVAGRSPLQPCGKRTGKGTLEG